MHLTQKTNSWKSSAAMKTGSDRCIRAFVVITFAIYHLARSRGTGGAVWGMHRRGLIFSKSRQNKAIHPATIAQYCYFCSMYYSYVIYNLEHHRFYYGITVDLKQTEKAHNEGLIEETRGFAPWNLVYQEEWKSKNDAIRRIRFYRTIGGQRHLKRVLNF